MEVMEAIMTRRSIRKYTDAPISDDMVRQMLEAAMMAPSAGNAQPWQFIVINERAKLDALKALHPYVSMVTQAQLGIFVCGDLSLEKFAGYWVQDCSAAMQNMLLAIHGMGLGAVWTGIYPMQDRLDKVREMIPMPDTVIPLGFVPIGYPAQSPKSESRYKEERVHYNSY